MRKQPLSFYLYFNFLSFCTCTFPFVLSIFIFFSLLTFPFCLFYINVFFLSFSLSFFPSFFLSLFLSISLSFFLSFYSFNRRKNTFCHKLPPSTLSNPQVKQLLAYAKKMLKTVLNGKQN